MGDKFAGLTKEREGVYIDAQGRRVWDKDFFSGKGQSVPEEEEEEKEELHVSKRKKRIDFSSTVGVSVFDGDARKVGFVCKICNHTCKDNLDYLDHLNDPSHLAKAGISREIKKCTVDDVRGVLTGKRTRKEYGLYDDDMM